MRSDPFISFKAGEGGPVAKGKDREDTGGESFEVLSFEFYCYLEWMQISTFPTKDRKIIPKYRIQRFGSHIISTPMADR